MAKKESGFYGTLDVGNFFLNLLSAVEEYQSRFFTDRQKASGETFEIKTNFRERSKC